MNTFKNLSEENQKTFHIKSVISYDLEAVRFTMNKSLQSINDVPTLEALSHVLEDAFDKFVEITDNYFKSTTHDTEK